MGPDQLTRSLDLQNSVRNSLPKPLVTITATYHVDPILIKSQGRIVEYSGLLCCANKMGLSEIIQRKLMEE